MARFRVDHINLKNSLDSEQKKLFYGPLEIVAILESFKKKEDSQSDDPWYPVQQHKALDNKHVTQESIKTKWGKWVLFTLKSVPILTEQVDSKKGLKS